MSDSASCRLAATLVGFGIADYLLAPAYGKLQNTGEQMSE